MMQAKQLIKWLKTLDPDTDVWIDEGGLTLETPGIGYLELGGEESNDDDEFTCGVEQI